MDNINTVIDLGTNKLRCAVFKYDKDESNLIAFSEIKTVGLHNSLVTNFDDACKSIRKIIGEVEKKIDLNIEKITVMIEPTEIITTRLTKFKKMAGSKIEKNDVNFILRESKKNLEKNDVNLSQMHMFNHKYIVDNKIYHELPINTFCDQFSIENIFISVPKNILKNISEVMLSCDLEIDKFISPSYSNGANLLNKNQHETGGGIIDIGYERTSVALFNNFSLIKLYVFPIGSNHITKDISKVCYLSHEESEKIKLDLNLFIQYNKNKNHDDCLPKNFFITSNYRKIPIKLIQDIIYSRILEIIEIIQKTIKEERFDTINNNLLFIGEGSKIIDLFRYIDPQSKNNLLQSFQLIDLNEHDSKLLNCKSGQFLFINGWHSEAVAVPFEVRNKGIFTRILDIFN